jgi:tRNA uridine 5-carboxymethylaminomethyl modification enzyme
MRTDDGEQKLEPPSNEMAKSIRNLGFPVRRLRTGTPPRLELNSINFEGMDEQISDDPPQLFSYLHEY